MGFFDALSRGLERSREALNEVFYFGGEVDEDFWEDLEDTLVMGDMGAEVAIKVSDDLRDAAAKKNLKTAPQLRRALAEQLEQHFVPIERDPFSDTPSCVLFVGINGAGKTTTVGKIASALASPSSSATAAPTRQVFATTCSTRPTSAAATWCSSIPPVVCTRAPSSCASLPRWSM